MTTPERAAMRQALEALIEHGAAYQGHFDSYHAAITALRAALSQPEQQEPVAWVFGSPEVADSTNVVMAHEYDPDEEHRGEWTPLYLHPAREWRGLSAHEINDAYIKAEKQAEDAFAVTRRQIADAITAKLKEKNA